MKQLRGKPLKDFLKQAEPPQRELVFVLQDVQDPVNVGSAFRIADACGVCASDIKCYTGAPLFWGDKHRQSYIEASVAAGHEFNGAGSR